MWLTLAVELACAPLANVQLGSGIFEQLFPVPVQVTDVLARRLLNFDAVGTLFEPAVNGHTKEHMGEKRSHTDCNYRVCRR
ncbi:hypothetical protein [Halalkaliarchaeum desulfuricum]|uniref:hypothetical protein n=1 Tax=Halalkaliarchaeum desulfuricum TaxID=2055893 RepID=UPI000E6BB080|nr:hypothetical protein [Halalkaliarchaeum desulfuricum]